jgi:hypothetical protein
MTPALALAAATYDKDALGAAAYSCRRKATAAANAPPDTQTPPSPRPWALVSVVAVCPKAYRRPLRPREADQRVSDLDHPRDETQILRASLTTARRHQQTLHIYRH